MTCDHTLLGIVLFCGPSSLNETPSGSSGSPRALPAWTTLFVPHQACTVRLVAAARTMRVRCHNRLRSSSKITKMKNGNQLFPTSHVTLHTSHFTRHTSHVTRHTSHVKRHTSHVTRHTSHVTRHSSRVTQQHARALSIAALFHAAARACLFSAAGNSCGLVPFTRRFFSI